MADVIPFINYRPAPEAAAEYAALPYDVFSRAEAATEIAAHPLSFLRIDSTTAIMPAEINEYDPCVYARTKELLAADEHNGVLMLEPDRKPHYYLYRLVKGQHVQTGVVGCVSVDDYNNNIIKRHENTRTQKRQDRIEHITALNAHTGPVLIAYRAHEDIDEVVAAATTMSATTSTMLYDFVAPDGIRHSVWRIDDDTIAANIQQAFTGVSALYIADGHHRAAAAALLGEQRGGEASHFLAVLFPADQLKILDYNRVVFDLNGHTLDEFLRLVGKTFELSKQPDTCASHRPDQRGIISMYVDKTWYRLAIPEYMRPNDPVMGLDVSLLQNLLLDPLLGIDDPRSSRRITHVGGARGLDELERKADASGGVAFALYPCSFEELFTVADAGELMPPKSTWFEPKPRSGLFIHKI